MNRWTIGLIVVVVILAIILGFNFFGGTPKKVDGPLTKEAKALVAGQEDRREAEDILDAELARQVPCGAVADHAFVVFGESERSPRVWVHMRQDGVIECYDAPITHPSARVKLKGITTLEVDIIKSNPEVYPPTRKPVATPAPTPTSTPTATPAARIEVVVVPTPAPAPCASAPGVRILSEGRGCS